MKRLISFRRALQKFPIQFVPHYNVVLHLFSFQNRLEWTKVSHGTKAVNSTIKILFIHNEASPLINVMRWNH